MIDTLLRKLTARLPAKAIDLYGGYYIERYRVLMIGPLEILLHRYLGSDGDRAVHDHPHRWCIGIPITGGYTEERLVCFCHRNGWLSRQVHIRPWRWNWVSCQRFHRIASVRPGTWTLFIRWRRFRGWGFLQKIQYDQHQTTRDVMYFQPYSADSENPDGWTDTAPRGKEFRTQRGTDCHTKKYQAGRA